MTLEEARIRVEEIRATAGDDESAHYEEDAFRTAVLRCLAEVAPAELGELARIALSTEEIKFCRWYA